MKESKGMEKLLEQEIIKVSKLFAAMDKSPQDAKECIVLSKGLLKHNKMLLGINTSDELKTELTNIKSVTEGVLEYFTDKIAPKDENDEI